MAERFCYNASHYFHNSNVYNLINTALNIQLKNNCDEHECNDYLITLETNMIFLYFKVPDMRFIRETMKKITDAIGQDESGWDYDEDNLDETVYLDGRTIYDNEFDYNSDIDYAVEESEQWVYDREEKRINEEKRKQNLIFPIKEYKDYTTEQAEFLNSIAVLVNKFNLEETFTNRVQLLIKHYQYLIVNLEKFYASISNKNISSINKLINTYILKAGQHKNEISQLICIPDDIHDDAIYIVTWAEELFQKILDTRSNEIYI
jgi:hypothetical protein